MPNVNIEVKSALAHLGKGSRKKEKKSRKQHLSEKIRT